MRYSYQWRITTGREWYNCASTWKKADTAFDRARTLKSSMAINGYSIEYHIITINAEGIVSVL